MTQSLTSKKLISSILQHLLEINKKERCPFHYRGLVQQCDICRVLEEPAMVPQDTKIYKSLGVCG